MSGLSRKARETVVWETPAAFAISRIETAALIARSLSELAGA
jgi:hypothetical protein